MPYDPRLMTVIDLENDALDPPSPSRHGRPGTAVLVAVLFALSTLVSATPVQPRIPELFDFSVPSDAKITLAGGLAVIAGQSTTVTAIDLTRMRPAWQTDTSIRPVSVTADGDHLLVDGATYVALLDRASGKLLWRKQGHLKYFGTTVVLDQDDVFTGWHLDGSDAWALPHQGLVPMIDPVRKVVATIDPGTGLFVERDLGTFKELRRVTLPAFEDVYDAIYVGDTMEIATSALRRETRDITTLNLLTDRPETDPQRRDCGLVWCDFDIHALIDKSTGERVTWVDPWAGAVYTKAGVVGLRRVGPSYEVAEIWDSRARAELRTDPWTVLNTAPQNGDPLLLGASGPKATRLAMFDDNGLFIAGVVPVGDIHDCTFWQDVLVCLTGANRVGGWRIR